MKNKRTELVFILDRSGSMAGLETDTTGGFNSLIERQKKEEGEATVTTVLFDNEIVMIHDGTDLNKVGRLTEKEYYVRGSTALLDAIGSTVNYVGNRQKMLCEGEKASKVVVAVITDGMENSSKEYDRKTVKYMIERQKNKYGWEFLFLGANMDAVGEASKIGIEKDAAVSYRCDAAGTAINFGAVGKRMAAARAGKALSGEWKKDIEKYNDEK